MQSTLFRTFGSEVAKCNTSILELKSTDEFQLSFSYWNTVFGRCLVASTEKGISFLSIGAKDENLKQGLISKFNTQTLVEQPMPIHKSIIKFINGANLNKPSIYLHLMGSPFQLKVWNALVKIPFEATRTYSQIADELNINGAARAVGTAIGNNPIAILIPCHRVIQKSGKLGGYKWGLPLKKKLLLTEQ